jgi:hypothetical protein
MKSYCSSSLNKKILTRNCSSLFSHLLKKPAAAPFLSPQKPKSSSASRLLLPNWPEESRGGRAAVWRGSHGGGIDSMGLAVELIAWVSRWRRGLAVEGAGVDLAVEELRRSVDLPGEELTAWVSRWSTVDAQKSPGARCRFIIG